MIFLADILLLYMLFFENVLKIKSRHVYITNTQKDSKSKTMGWPFDDEYFREISNPELNDSRSHSHEKRNTKMKHRSISTRGEKAETENDKKKDNVTLSPLPAEKTERSKKITETPGNETSAETTEGAAETKETLQIVVTKNTPQDITVRNTTVTSKSSPLTTYIKTPQQSTESNTSVTVRPRETTIDNVETSDYVKGNVSSAAEEYYGYDEDSYYGNEKPGKENDSNFPENKTPPSLQEFGDFKPNGLEHDVDDPSDIIVHVHTRSSDPFYGKDDLGSDYKFDYDFP